MSKQSGWKIAATEGATIDGRTITKQWIEDMADQYSMAEYGALIWPEHSVVDGINLKVRTGERLMKLSQKSELVNIVYW